MTKSEILQKLKRFCAYRERCHSEVRSKLISIKVYGDDLEEIILELIQDDYLNEERFARSYARGKHRINRWGKNKITKGLKFKAVSQYCIKKGLSEIEDDDYVTTLHTVIDIYYTSRQGKYQEALLKKKTIEHALNKGYEYHLIIEALNARLQRV